MGSKTKIMVFRMRELIYTGIFAAFLLVLIILLILMFKPKKTAAVQQPETRSQTPAASSTMKYTAGVYTTPITVNDNAIDVEVIVDSDYIKSIQLVNLSESVTTMYPLIQPALEEIAVQIYEKQSTDDILYSEESKYTSQILLNAIKEALAIAKSDISQIE